MYIDHTTTETRDVAENDHIYLYIGLMVAVAGVIAVIYRVKNDHQ